jgi:DNA excision repair protein ERCC-3
VPFGDDKPLIIQSDRTLLLETGGPRYEAARDHLARFAELIKSPERIHTYRVTPLSLWNAAATGMDADGVLAGMREFSRYEVPPNVETDIREYVGRFGRMRLVRELDGTIVLEADDDVLITEALHAKGMDRFVETRLDRRRLAIRPEFRGDVKQAMIKIGRPVEDLAGYVRGAVLDVTLSGEASTTDGGSSNGAASTWTLRDYQRSAVAVFHAGGSEKGGSGVVVLPCGAGKTVVGIGAIVAVGSHTLILTANTTAVRQWKEELLARTSLTPDQVGEYTGDKKEIRPVTVATYQMVTHKKSKIGAMDNLPLFDTQDWGLIVYDEVHLLPAPIFRATASLQARRRLGLTATLVREDGREEDVFALIGPKKYDVPWKELEAKGWIAKATCREIRVPFKGEAERIQYAGADKRDKFTIAACNPMKVAVVKRLAEAHANDHVLVIGQYLDQLELTAKALAAPMVTGKTPQRERDSLYEKFKTGEIPRLVVSKVANFAIDLPDANVAIQISGTFGSRQEEAQRLGRVLRPKAKPSGDGVSRGGGGEAMFYTLVTHDSVELDYAARRQLFLTEQGYRYEIEAVGRS